MNRHNLSISRIKPMAPRHDLAKALWTKAEREEYRRSERKGFRQNWAVQKYELQNGFLVTLPSGPSAPVLYYPIVHTTLPSELAKLHASDEPAVLRFVQRYGHLGYDQLVDEGIERRGDPLKWVWAHSELLRLCLGLMAWLPKRDTTKLRHCFEVYQQSGFSPLQTVYPATEKAVNWYLLTRVPVEDVKDKDVIGYAEQVLFEILINNICGVQRTLSGSIGQGGPFYQFRALIEVAYWHLADAYEAGSVVARCQARDCGAYFVQTDARQRFCPPRFDPHAKSRFAESTCAVRQRLRRLRKAAKESRATAPQQKGSDHGTARR